MRATLVLVFLFLSFAAFPQKNAAWQSDLRFLQQTIHKDYPFLFRNISAAAFDAAVDQLYDAMPGMQEHECLAGLTRMVASIKYGHTSLPWRDSKLKFHMTPLNFYWFSDGLYVEGTTKDNSDILGAKILKVEGKPVLEVLQAIRPLVPAENNQFFKSRGPDYLGIPEALHAQGVTNTLKNNITYIFEKNGKTFEKVIPATEAFQIPKFYGFTKPGGDWLTARDTSTLPLYLKNQDRIYYYEYLPESKTVYIRHSQIQDEPELPISVFYKNLYSFIEKNEVERLVLDVRLNGGGNNYLLKPIITGLIETKKINRPGKFFVIIGRRTFSACQNLVNEFSNYTNAIFVGEPTAENINFYGDNNRITLPKTQTRVLLSFAWWQDKPQWENAAWLAPQVAADMSFADYQQNTDPSLNACLAMNESNAVTDPMQKLKTLFMMGKLEEVEKETARMVNDPIYRYIDFEANFSEAGSLFIKRKQNDIAIKIFEMNTRLFPDSPRSWLGLAEAYTAAGQKNKALHAWEKLVSLDPSGPSAEEAKKRIIELKAGN